MACYADGTAPYTYVRDTSTVISNFKIVWKNHLKSWKWHFSLDSKTPIETTVRGASIKSTKIVILLGASIHPEQDFVEYVKYL